MSETEADAVALFRPRVFERLKPFLDLEDESEVSEGLYAELLEDGAVLVHTFQPYAVFAESPEAAAEWLEQFGDALPDVHEDIRGLLVFPDTIEPEGQSYEDVVDEIAGDGVWIPFGGSAAPFGIDVGQLAAIAGRLAGGGTAPSSFELGQMLSGMQQNLLDAITSAMGEAPGTESEDEDGEEVQDEPTSETPRK